MKENKLILDIYNTIQNGDCELKVIGDIESKIHDYLYFKGGSINKFIEKLGLDDYYFVMGDELHTLNNEKPILKGKNKIMLFLIKDRVERVFDSWKLK